MQREFWKGVAAGMIRIALGSVAGYLIHKGAVTSFQWEIIVGALASFAVASVWSLMQKYGVDDLVKTALRMPANTSPEDLARVRGGQATVDVFNKSSKRPKGKTIVNETKIEVGAQTTEEVSAVHKEQVAAAAAEAAENKLRELGYQLIGGASGIVIQA